MNQAVKNVKQIKQKNVISLDFAPHAAQREIASACTTHKRVVIRAGRRFGKSALALNIVLREALNTPGRYWIIAPEYTQAKSIYWRDLVAEYVPRGLILKKNDNELILEIQTLVEGKTSIIEFKGSDREDKLRGAGLRGVVLDEYAFQKEYVWDKIVSPMLTQTDGWAIFITTPNGVANHFKKFWDNAVKLVADGDKDWATFHFTSYDNPTIKRENLDKERERLTEEFFQQEYMADFAKFVGLIYTNFDDKIHVQDFVINEEWSFYRSIDFGSTDPNAVSFIGVDKDDTCYFFDELYITDITTSELAELIKQKSAHRYFISTYADSAAKQSIIDLAQFGIYATPARKNAAAKETGSKQWIIAGINQVQQKLKENKIVIHPRCKATIKEFMSYSWRKDRLGDAVNIPEDKNNHCLTGETLIWTKDGKKQIKDMVGTEGYVYSTGGKLRKYSNVRKVGKETIYRVEFDDGSVVRASSEHPFILANGDYMPASLLNANDLIQSVTYENNNHLRNKATVQWKKLLVWQRQILQASIPRQIIPTTQGGLGISQRQNTKGYANQSYRLGLEEQPDRKSGTSNSSSKHGVAKSKRNSQTKGSHREHTTASKQVAWVGSRDSLSFRAFQAKLAKERDDSQKLLSMWQRIRYSVSDAVKVLPPELQNERPTKQIKRITREHASQEVYNFEVEGTRTYVLGNGTLTSNCLDEIRYFFGMYKGQVEDEMEFNYLGQGVVDSTTGY